MKRSKKRQGTLQMNVGLSMMKMTLMNMAK